MDSWTHASSHPCSLAVCTEQRACRARSQTARGPCISRSPCGRTRMSSALRCRAVRCRSRLSGTIAARAVRSHLDQPSAALAGQHEGRRTTQRTKHQGRPSCMASVSSSGTWALSGGPAAPWTAAAEVKATEAKRGARKGENRIFLSGWRALGGRNGLDEMPTGKICHLGEILRVPISRGRAQRDAGDGQGRDKICLSDLSSRV